jgi:hypothetical protein
MNKEDLIGRLELTQVQANRLAIKQQIAQIKMIEHALQHTYKGESWLYGNRVSEGQLLRAKNELARLDRERGVLNSDRKHLPYLSGAGSITDKIIDHYDSDGNITVVEMTEGSTGKRVKAHLISMGTIKKQIKKKQMATKKKAAKKAAPKKKAGGPSIKSVVDGLVAKGKSNEFILEHFKKNKLKGTENSIRWYASKARGELV